MVQNESLTDYLSYNYYVDADGTLRRNRTYKQWIIGREVGVVGVRGYKTLSIKGKRYYVHRLIFLMEHGYLPDLIDHLDGDKTNNRISNLRDSSKVSNALNIRYCHKDNATAFLGVTYRKDTGKYSARFRNENLGCFDTPEEAHAVYVKAKSR